MSVAEELREWATAKNLTPEGWMSNEAWEALCSCKQPRDWGIGMRCSDDRRTFALLVAAALETQDD